MTSGTPDAEAARSELARLQRLRALVKFAGLAWFLPLFIAGFIVAVATHATPIGVMLIVFGVAGRLAVSALDISLSVRLPRLTYEAAGSQRWWYDPRSGSVEEGMMPRGRHRDGPYRTRDDALRAPEIARERAAAWNAEDDWSTGSHPFAPR